MDNGPWKVWRDRDGRVIGVMSDDFRRDVGLTMSGDFGRESIREDYAKWLAARLNGSPITGGSEG
jgi:hypothetical protein